MPKTVLFLHRGGSRIRGTEEALLSLLAGLDRDAFEPVVFCTAAAMREAVAALGAEAHLYEPSELLLVRGEVRLGVRGYLRALRRVGGFCRARGVDLLVSNGGGPCQLGVPVARWLGKPLVCMFHHPAPRAYHRMWLTRHADALVFASRFTAEHTRARTGRDGETIHVGVDARGRFVPAPHRDPAVRQSLGIGPDDVVFAQVGALVPHKEHATLVEAFAEVARRLPAARLLVVGAGPEEEAVRRRVRELGLEDRVTLAGFVESVLPCFQHAIDVNVLASREEGLGLVNLQASACALPVVGADGSGIRETVVHGETGLLFPVGDARALAECMVRLGRDPGLREAFGRAGRRMVLERFSVEGFRRRVQEVMRARAGLPAGAAVAGGGA